MRTLRVDLKCRLRGVIGTKRVARPCYKKVSALDENTHSPDWRLARRHYHAARNFYSFLYPVYMTLLE